MIDWVARRFRFQAENLARAIGDQLWLRPALAGIFAVAFALGGIVFDDIVAQLLPMRLSQDALSGLLSIFTSSMLAVATFAVSAMVTAIASVSSNVTPRATRLILQDATAQNVLASFIGAFVYSLIALLALEAVDYGNGGRLFLFVGLVGIVVWILIAFLRWVDHVTTMGRVGPTIEALAEAACATINAHSSGTFGARAYDGAPPPGAQVEVADKVGYLTNIDLAGLNEIAVRHDVDLFVAKRPGALMSTVTPMFYLGPAAARAITNPADLLACVSIEPARSYQKDVRLGLLNLSETADRALSPAVNDPGTAITILSKQLQVLTRWAEFQRDAKTRDVLFERILVPQVDPHDLIDDAFTAISRDGAPIVEVGLVLQRTLGDVSRLGHQGLAEAALKQARIAMDLAERALPSPHHVARVRAVHEDIISFTPN